MSGGSFDYNCYRIQNFAEELKIKIDNNNVTDEDGYKYGKSEATLSLLMECHSIIELSGKLAREIEWLYSGDIGEETFAESVNKMLAGEEE
jgi:hypothetical protein